MSNDTPRRRATDLGWLARNGSVLSAIALVLVSATGVLVVESYKADAHAARDSAADAHRQVRQLESVLYSRCVDRIDAWRTRVDNLEGDLAALRHSRSYYTALSSDPSLAPSVVELIRGQLASVVDSIQRKRAAIAADIEPNCDELNVASNEATEAKR